ncbi:hypothetical protein [Tenacibaculum singaporense]|uniref:hypothetical protein n=1 Tax=Tenacibaculum singaporense TaxID=2358479 RepID=UPI000F66074E|nr:hypothetical protein [Tenacibaculum singaporense]RSC94986.1 hypothetical protein EI424_04880 [Tenacibaculum singaporense]
MKVLKYILSILLITIISSCSSNDIDEKEIDETTTLNYIQTLSNTTHNIEVFSTEKSLQQGYNDIYLRVIDKASDTYVTNATLTWSPMMHMNNMMHSCPKSLITKADGTETLYKGYIIFQMAENDTEKWSLTVNYTIDSKEYSIEDQISVPAAAKKNVAVFMGVDKTKYVLALINPTTPKVGMNDLKVGLFKMETMISFPKVEDYLIKNDPRMPSMGNHTSPNNTDLTFDSTTKLYKGDLSLTMTGYWKLNLMVYNNSEELIKGEMVTEENESSSLYLELEF